MMRRILQISKLLVLISTLLLPNTVLAIPGVAPGIPEAEQRNAIVQLFNWKFTEIRDVLPQLKELGFNRIHVSPPQKSNEAVYQWWKHYQPVDFSMITGY